jgi:hypothetical protein
MIAIKLASSFTKPSRFFVRKNWGRSVERPLEKLAKNQKAAEYLTENPKVSQMMTDELRANHKLQQMFSDNRTYANKEVDFNEIFNNPELESEIMKASRDPRVAETDTAKMATGFTGMHEDLQDPDMDFDTIAGVKKAIKKRTGKEPTDAQIKTYVGEDKWADFMKADKEIERGKIMKKIRERKQEMVKGGHALLR